MSTDAAAADGLAEFRRRLDSRLRDALVESSELGFLGTMPIDDQIDHALGFVAIVEDRLGRQPTGVLDLGTGGGVPGLVLLSCWADARIVLIDASERRTDFLSETIEGWPATSRGEVIRGRAEELGRHEDLRERFEVVTSRSFGIPALAAECGSAFLAPGGWMIVSEPPNTDPDVRWPADGLSILALETDRNSRVTGRFGYQLIGKVSELDDRYPRRVGVPAKRPLF
jgi:16S rRNA (guanine527-N7)-methyltransferase